LLLLLTNVVEMGLGLLLGALTLGVGLDLSMGTHELHPSNNYKVSVNGKDSFVYLAAVEAAEKNGQVNASFVHITLPADGVVNVVVSVLTANSSAPLRSAALRPRGSPEVVLHGDAALSFSIASAGNYVLELDGTFTVASLDVRAVKETAHVTSFPPHFGDEGRAFAFACIGASALPASAPADAVEHRLFHRPKSDSFRCLLRTHSTGWADGVRGQCRSSCSGF
jgi:hypothetical protein